MTGATDTFDDMLAMLDAIEPGAEKRKELCAMTLAAKMDSMAGRDVTEKDIDMIERLTHENWGGDLNAPCLFASSCAHCLGAKIISFNEEQGR